MKKIMILYSQHPYISESIQTEQEAPWYSEHFLNAHSGFSCMLAQSELHGTAQMQFDTVT